MFHGHINKIRMSFQGENLPIPGVLLIRTAPNQTQLSDTQCDMYQKQHIIATRNGKEISHIHRRDFRSSVTRHRLISKKETKTRSEEA